MLHACSVRSVCNLISSICVSVVVNFHSAGLEINKIYIHSRIGNGEAILYSRPIHWTSEAIYFENYFATEGKSREDKRRR